MGLQELNAATPNKDIPGGNIKEACCAAVLVLDTMSGQRSPILWMDVGRSGAVEEIRQSPRDRLLAVDLQSVIRWSGSVLNANSKSGSGSFVRYPTSIEPE